MNLGKCIFILWGFSLLFFPSALFTIFFSPYDFTCACLASKPISYPLERRVVIYCPFPPSRLGIFLTLPRAAGCQTVVVITPKQSAFFFFHPRIVLWVFICHFDRQLGQGWTTGSDDSRKPLNAFGACELPTPLAPAAPRERNRVPEPRRRKCFDRAHHRVKVQHLWAVEPTPDPAPGRRAAPM